MKFVKSHYEILEQEPGISGIYKAIEIAGRVCYLSNDKITEDSAKPFVDRMIASGHGAMLEHGTVYLRTYSNYDYDREVYERYKNNPYSRVEVIGSIEGTNDTLDGYYITTNYRTIIENNWLDDLKFLCEPTEYHEKRVAVHFILPIGISREFCRHRVFSFAEQSTRYCDFSADKFNNELTFIEDQWCDEELLRQIEYWYISSHLKPQEKRNVLPLCTKTELVMTGFVSDWEHVFRLRTSIAETGRPHPQMLELMDPLYEEFIRRNLISKIK